MSKFEYKESFKSKFKVFLKKQRWILSYKKKIFLNRKNVDVVERSKYHIRNIKDSNKKTCYNNIFKAGDEPKVAVYTCIFGNYDSVKKINCKSKFCDYWVITDQLVDDGSGWKILNVDFPEDVKDATPAIKNRYCKMHPHILFPEYDFSIYIDGSIQPDADIFPLIGRLGNCFIGMYDHFQRDCIYEEAKTVVRVNKENSNIVEKQVEKYKEEGFPEHYGLTACGIIARKHNDPLCIKIMDEWWNIFLNYSKRDQLGFMYVMWKNGLKREDIATLGYNYEYEARFLSEGHKK